MNAVVAYIINNKLNREQAKEYIMDQHPDYIPLQIDGLLKLSFAENKFTSEIKKSPFTIKPMKKIGLQNCKKNDELIARLAFDKGSIGILVSEGNTGKTMLAQYMMLCIESGLPLFGQFNCKKSKVLHFDLEQTEKITQKRYEILSNGMELSIFNIDRMSSLFTIGDDTDSEDLINELSELFSDYGFVLIDSLTPLINGDENNNTLAAKIMTIFHQVAEKANCFILFIAHTKKGGFENKIKQSVKGASSFYNNVDLQINLIREDDEIRLTYSKMRDGAFPDDLFYQMKISGTYFPEYRTSEKISFELLAESPKNLEETEFTEIALSYIVENKLTNFTKTDLCDKLLHVVSLKYKNISRDKVRDLIASLLIDKALIDNGGKRCSPFNLTENGKSYFDYQGN